MDTSFEPYRRDAFRHRSIQAQRESISLDNIPGEGTVNTEGLWRRQAIDWHFGAGQPFFDRKDSNDARYSISKGVNPWMQWQLSLLNDTEQVFNLNGSAQVLQVGNYVYVLDLNNAQSLQFSPDLTTWTTVTGIPQFQNTAMATDGFDIWIANTGFTTTGLYHTSAGAAGATPYVTNHGFDGVYWVADRLMTTWLNNLYNITTVGGPQSVGSITTGLTIGGSVTSLAFSGGITNNIPINSTITVGPVQLGAQSFTQSFTNTAAQTAGDTSVAVTSAPANFSYPTSTPVYLQLPVPTPLWTHPNANFRFSAAAAGAGNIYYAGHVPTGQVPQNSVIYQNTIEPTGTALTVPVQALPLEGGEYATSLYGYLNYIFVGSNLGVRMCRTLSQYDPTGNQGDLEAGPLLPGLFPPGPVNSPVRALIGNNRFMYFGWNNYDNLSTGLGRLDLSTFIDTQAPAFASDLMVSGEGQITSMDWCNINNQPIFVVEGNGVYTGTNTVVPSGYVQSGAIGYGIPDDKIVLAGAIGTDQPQHGSISLAVASDAAGSIAYFQGSQGANDPNQKIIPIEAFRGKNFATHLVLTRDPTTLASPVLNRWMLKAIPGITSGTTISVVLRLWNVEEILGQDTFFDPYVEKAFLENLRATQTVFQYNEGPLTYPYCTIDEIDWLPHSKQYATVEGGYQGNIIAYIKTYDLGT